MKHWLTALACCAVAAATGARAGEVGGSIVVELLAGRTAHISSASGDWLIYHARDGALAVSMNGAAVRPGRWWTDDAGRFCIAVDDDGKRCFTASMNESRLELRDVASGEQSVVTSLEPGDTGALLAGHAEADAPCDCRLTSRRRGEGNVR